MAYDAKYMERAIKLAKLGIGRVDPNPLVGAVIVKDGKIIGEGYHTGYGMLHAEREAINSLLESAHGAEMYVTMEPCAHTGKQPPCTSAIIDAGIRTVYVGSSDPNPKVDGKGIWMLRQHGIEVVTGCMKKECDALNPVYFHYITTKRPYVVLKYAVTLDGKIATTTGASRYISGDFARGRVRGMRNQYPAIMVGIGTVLADDPTLDNRRQKDRTPVRIICDTHLQIPMDSKIVQTAGKIETYVAASERIPEDAKKKAEELEEKNVHVLLIPEKDGHIDVDALMDKLGEMEISGIMSEGGGNLSWSLLREGIVNEVVMFIAPKIFGGITAMTPVEGEGVNFVEDALPLHLVESEILPGGDIYARYIVGPEPEEEDEPMDIETAEPRPLAWISSSPAPEAPKDFQSGAVIETPKTEEAAPAADSLEAMEMGSVSRSKKQQEGWVEADAIPSQEPEGADLEDLYDRPPVELENRIVTAVLSADLNPFNIDENKDK